MDSLLQDIRHSIRALRRSPGFTALAVVTLALAIGVNTAIFSVFNAVLLRPLDYRDSGRLLWLGESFPARGWTGMNVSGPVYTAWEERNRTFEAVAARAGQNSVLNGHGEPQEITLGLVTEDFFTVLGMAPVAGRLFTHDDVKAAPDALILARNFWLTQFGGDTAVIGTTAIINDVPRMIIGVVPNGDEWTDGYDAYVAMPPVLAQMQLGNHMLGVVGRMRPNVVPRVAEADLAAISAGVYQSAPADARGWTPNVRPLLDQSVGGSRTTLGALLGAVVFVLLIACANLANLTLVRAQSRRREVVVRAALGAGRWRLTRVLMAESAILALAGAGAGLLLGMWGIDGIVALGRQSLPRLDHVRVDPAVLGFTVLVTGAATVLFGVLPAIRASRTDIQRGLREADSRVARTGWTRDVLAVVETALALVLATGATLLVQSLSRQHRIDLGYDPAGVIVLDLDLPPQRFENPESRTQLVQQVEARIRALPGVAAVGSTRALPLESGGGDTEFGIVGRSPSAAGGNGWSYYTPVSPAYLAAMKARLIAGRHLTETDDRVGAPRVVVVNETFAKKYWPGASPLGAHISLGPAHAEIVGVVADLRQRVLRDPVQPAMFVPFSQAPTISISMVVRAAGDPLALVPALHRAVWAVDPLLPVEQWTMNDLMQSATAESRFSMSLLAAFALLAIVLAIIGVYGVVSYGVAQRHKEIGLRMALGAQRHDVLRMVLRRGFVIAIAGVVLGVAGAFAVSKLLRGLLYNVSPTDPLTLLAASAGIAVLITAGCMLPARRATRVDPMVALRSE